VRHFDGAPARSISWLELDAGELVVTGKGARMRRVPVGRAALAALADWLPVRGCFLAATPAADRRALFLGARGARIGARMVQRRIAARGQATGIEVPVSPHMLRHSFASHLLQSSGDLRAVQELLGHASIASTQIYTALDFQRLAAVYDAAHPRARRAGPASDP
jgi:integrase/recombinase XerC